MTEQATPTAVEEEDIDLLDLLVTIAESWKLLLFVPLLAGVLAATIASFYKPTYQSTAIVRLTEEESAVLHSAAVLDPLLAPFGYQQKAKGIAEDARQALKKDLSYSVDKRTKLVTITAKGPSPELAQQLNHQAIARLVEELTPKGLAKIQIEQSIADHEKAIAAAEQALAKMLEALAAQGGEGFFAEQAATSFSNSANFILSNKQEVQALELRLLPKSSELFVQSPTLPQKPIPRKVALMATLTVLASGFALLLFVFIRQALVKASANPESAAKLASIRRSLGFAEPAESS